MANLRVDTTEANAEPHQIKKNPGNQSHFMALHLARPVLEIRISAAPTQLELFKLSKMGQAVSLRQSSQAPTGDATDLDRCEHATDQHG